MNHHWKDTANEIIRLLLLGPIGNPKLADLMEECRKHGDWAMAIDRCRQQYMEVGHELLPGAEYLMKGVCHMCEGASHYAKGEWQKAIDSYRFSKQIFEYEDYGYGQGIALMALSLAYQALNEQEEAIRLCRQSHRIFQGLQERHELRPDASKALPYQALCGRLQSMISKVRYPHRPHLVSLVGEVAAGEPLYMPGEDSQNPTGEIVLDGTTYKLLTVGERKPKNDSVFSPSEKYFVITVKGNSMIGANINDGDRLLVKKQDGWPELREIAVFQEQDSGPMVKKFYREAHRIYLESANHKYGPRIYDEDSPTLRTIGVVVAILREWDD